MLSELKHFKSYPHNLRILLLTNLVYAMILPILELFVGAFILRNVPLPDGLPLFVQYQIAVYSGVPFTFFLNGYLLRFFKITHLYAFGIFMCGIAMAILMALNIVLGEFPVEYVVLAGFLMGASYGFFWANRDFMAIDVTDDSNRNYYYSMETVFYTITFIIVPMIVGWIITLGEQNSWYAANTAYIGVTAFIFALTFVALNIINRGQFNNPKNDGFLYLDPHILWLKQMGLGLFKGTIQGALMVTPTLLVMKFFGTEGALGSIISMSSMISAVALYFIARFSKPAHRIWIFAGGVVFFALAGLLNSALYSQAGVVMFMILFTIMKPLHDVAYYPIQLKVIEFLSKLRNKNEFAYIFAHEFALWMGRVFGCLIFLAFYFKIGESAALMYAPFAIGLFELLSIWLAKNVIKSTDMTEEEFLEQNKHLVK